MINKCDSDTKQHIANMMTVITTSTFALYAAEKVMDLDDQLELEHLLLKKESVDLVVK